MKRCNWVGPASVANQVWRESELSLTCPESGLPGEWPHLAPGLVMRKSPRLATSSAHLDLCSAAPLLASQLQAPRQHRLGMSARRNAAREIASYRQLQQLPRQLLGVNLAICRLCRPLASDTVIATFGVQLIQAAHRPWTCSVRALIGRLDGECGEVATSRPSIIATTNSSASCNRFANRAFRIDSCGKGGDLSSRSVTTGSGNAAIA